MIYAELVIKQKTGVIEKIEISDIARELMAQGYNIEEKDAMAKVNLNSDDISIVTKTSGTIEFSYESVEGTEFYAFISGKYYKMMLGDSGVVIDRIATEIQDGECAGRLDVSVTSGTTVTVGEVSADRVKLNAGDKAGVSVVTVKYGNSVAKCNVLVVKKPLVEEPNLEVTFNTDYGLVEVIWLNEGTNTYSEIPNEPELYNNLESNKRLTPVTWTFYEEGTSVDGKTVNWVEDSTAKANWYNYTAEKGKDGKEDNTTSMWANAKNYDGSYFVWIPRYAYRIIYYSDASYTNVTGYYDGYGLWEAGEGKKKYDLDAGIETVEHDGKNYIVHPAFVQDTNKADAEGNPLEDYARGGWDKDLTGIWVAKYEMSREGATAESSGTGYSSAFKSVPNVQAARSIAVGNMYQVSINYDTSKESHMIKNSEWGAAALLTHSQYGRNGHEININESPSYITGSGSTIENSEEVYAYNTTNGAKASSTGNIYGIYDMSGGTWEHVAGYNRVGQSSKLTSASYGGNMTKNAKNSEGKYVSTKYITAYENSTTDNGTTEMLLSIGNIGDAMKEMRTSVERYCWFDDFSQYVASGAPYFGRSGSYSYGTAAGIFYSDSTGGQALAGVSFRISLGQ